MRPSHSFLVLGTIVAYMVMGFVNAPWPVELLVAVAYVVMMVFAFHDIYCAWWRDPHRRARDRRR